jgi:hypothetical protein
LKATKATPCFTIFPVYFHPHTLNIEKGHPGKEGRHGHAGTMLLSRSGEGGGKGKEGGGGGGDSNAISFSSSTNSESESPKLDDDVNEDDVGGGSGGSGGEARGRFFSFIVENVSTVVVLDKFANSFFRLQKPKRELKHPKQRTKKKMAPTKE